MWMNSSPVLDNLKVREAHFHIFATNQCLAYAQSLVSMVGNFAVMYLMLRTPELRSKNHNYLIFALAMSDFLFSVGVSLSCAGVIFINQILCIWGGVMIWVWALSSFGFPAILSFNRYVALYLSHRYEKLFTRPRVGVYILVQILITVLITLPYPLLGAVVPDPTYVLVCGPQSNTPALAVHNMVSNNAYIAFTYCIIVWCNWKCIKKLKENQNNTSGLRSPVIEESRKLIKMMVIVSVIPIPLLFPAVICKTIGDITGTPNPVAGMLTAVAYPLPSTINPYITLSVVAPYRKALMALLGKKTTTVVPAPVSMTAVQTL